MFKPFRLAAVLLVMITGLISAHDNLTFQDPRSWKSNRGAIDEATVKITPHGLFMQYETYLTFSTKSIIYFQPYDTLEVQFFFTLPNDAIINDLWLWVGNDIVRASILDMWTASSIYENIVKRRRDPAILFKRAQGDYELRIFPMAGKEPRKIKMTYLVPCQWNTVAVSAPLPVNFLQSSYPVPALEVLYTPAQSADSTWKNPRIPEYPDVTFNAPINDPNSKYRRAVIPSDKIKAGLNFALDSPMRDGLFLSRSGKNDEGVFQLAYLPSQALKIHSPKKTAILIDYDVTNSTLSLSDVVRNLKDAIKDGFNDKDSFNIIYTHQLAIKRASSGWIPADSAMVEKYFSDLIANPPSTYSSLPFLLKDGLAFIQSNGNNGSILLASDSDQQGDYNVANKLVTDLLNNINPYPQINIIDFQNTSYNYYNAGSKSYYGNEYFYDYIARLTKGIFKGFRNSGKSMPGMLAEIIQTFSGFISSFDMYTTLQNGYCYGRFNISSADPSVYLNRPILQVGKYKGSFPFNITVSGVIDSKVFTSKSTLQGSEYLIADSLLESVWAGNYIKSLELLAPVTPNINQIIDFSIKNRILSLYTSFLALEPNDTIKVCTSCMDKPILITGVKGDKNAQKDTLMMQAFPNPFNSQTIIKIQLPQVFDQKNVTMRVYNVLGEAIRTFDIKEAGSGRSLQLNWNGKDDNGQSVASGIYFFVISTQNSRQSLKLLMLK